ncbi:MAG: hypothetical protein ACI4UX_03745 [Clostridia bacterium]
MKYEFSNRGQTYCFRDDYCGGGNSIMIHYTNVMDELVDISLKFEEKGNLFKTKEYYIELSYKMFSYKDEIDIKKIYIQRKEYTRAQELVSIIKRKLLNIKNDKEKEEKGLKQKLEEKVRVIDNDGNEHFLNSYSSQLSDDKLCLVVEDSKTYHTWLDCYKKWLPFMQEEFDAWLIKNKKDVIKKGYSKCKFCEERDYDSEHFDEILDEISSNDN